MEVRPRKPKTESELEAERALEQAALSLARLLSCETLPGRNLLARYRSDLRKAALTYAAARAEI